MNGLPIALRALFIQHEFRYVIPVLFDRRQTLDGIVYDVLDHGHRQANLKTWQIHLGLTPMIARPSVKVLVDLVRAPHVMFATLDDAPLFFLAVGLIRLLAGKRTVGIFLRPQACFHEFHWKYRLKWLYFFIMSRIPRIAPVSMVPFFVNPRFAEVSSGWIYDPQNWDQADNLPDLTQRTALSERILAHAKGRKIIAALGGLNLFKGFDFFADMAVEAASFFDDAVFVACGPLAHDCHDHKSRIENAGGLVVPDYISDAEMVSIYGIADMVWACYPERFDQASGIFGRASQYGIPALVRAGSFNAQQAQHMGAAFLALPYGDARAAYAMISSPETRRMVPDQTMIRRFRAESLDCLRQAL